MTRARSGTANVLIGTLLSAVGLSAVAALQDRDAAVADSIDVAAGTAIELSFTVDVDSAFVADPETADVHVLDKRTLFVLGKSTGVTSLRVHASGGSLIAAYAVRVNAQAAPARAVLAHIAGEDSGIVVESVGNALFVSGPAQSPSQAERLLRGIGAVSSAIVVDALTVATPAQVNLEVVISEVARNVTQEFGIDWSVDINPFAHPLRTWVTGTGVRLGTGAFQIANIYEHVIQFLDPESPADTAPFTNEVNELGVEMPAPRGAEGGVAISYGKEINSGKYRATAFLDALAQNGLLVVHARPNLTTVSGQPAEFFSGLEIPVPSITDRGVVGTVYRQTGVGLTFTPTVLDREHISLTVEPRIREIAAGGTMIAGAVVPNINERSARTTVELGDGESIAIAGLYRRNTTGTESGIPLLKDIPVWGSLFRNARQTDRSAELIIVVTPRIVAAVPPPRAGVGDKRWRRVTAA